MKPEHRTCRNCEHRIGIIAGGQCARTGSFCDLERQYGGKCGVESRFWVARRPWWWRLVRSLLGIGGFLA